MDYEFHYRLNDMGDSSKTKIESLEEYYKRLIESILEVIEFTSDSNVVAIDGFKFVSDDKIIDLH